MSSAFAQPLINCTNSSTQTPKPVGDSPPTWATLLYRIRKIVSNSSGMLSNLKSEELGISIFYSDLNNDTKIRIEFVGVTLQNLIAADCWNDRLKDVSIYMYHGLSNEKITWKDLEDPIIGNIVLQILELLATRYIVPNQLSEVESQQLYLENIRNHSRNINAQTMYLSFGITDDFRLFSTEYSDGELIFWVYYRQSQYLIDD
jgi:hypothetical protein